MEREDRVLNILTVMPKYSNGMSDSDVAQQVLDGRWGVAANRKDQLERANYNYHDVQKTVNRMVVRKSRRARFYLFLAKITLAIIAFVLQMFTLDGAMSSGGVEIVHIKSLIISILLIIAVIILHRIYYILGVLYGILLLLHYPANKLTPQQEIQMRRIAMRYDKAHDFFSECGKRYEKYNRR